MYCRVLLVMWITVGRGGEGSGGRVGWRRERGKGRRGKR